MTNELKSLGKRFKQLREPFGTPQDIVDNSEFSLQFIKDLEEGTIDPTYLDLLKLAEVIDVYPADFFEEN